MIIIDRNTDYYDYVSNLYGKDPKIVFDRRGSILLTANIDLYTNPIKNFYKRYLYTNKPERFYSLLEIGTKQYLIQGYNIKRDRTTELPTRCDLRLLRTYNNQKNYYHYPLSIQQVRVAYRFGVSEETTIENMSFEEAIQTFEDRLIPLPILRETDITKIIEPTEIWSELQNYISSLNNERDTNLPMTQEERAELHGFDRKTSFRHPVK